MASSFSKVFIHLVWATKYRQSTIAPSWRRSVTRYLVSTCEQSGCRVLAANTVANHVHVLIWIPMHIPLSSVVMAAKGATSRFVNSTLDPTGSFEWQDGFSGHSVSAGLVPVVKKYIQIQQKRHSDMDHVFEFGFPPELPDDVSPIPGADSKGEPPNG